MVRIILKETLIKEFPYAAQGRAAQRQRPQDVVFERETENFVFVPRPLNKSWMDLFRGSLALSWPFMRLHLSCLFFFLFVFASLTTARTLDEIVVVGDRHAYAMGHSGAAITVIARKDIVRHAWRTLREALRSVPGLHVSSSGGHGAQTSIFMRAAESNHVLVLMDGVELTNPAADHLVDFADLPLEQVEKIEVIRGPYSSRYGSEALGGVINVISRRGHARRQAGVQLAYGSHHDRHARLTFSGSEPGTHGDKDHFSALSYWKTGGESFTPARLRMGGAAEDDAYRNFNFYTSLNGGLGEQESLHFNFNYSRTKSEYDGFSAPYEERLSDNKRSHYARLRLDGDYLNSLWRPSLQLSHYRRLFRADAHRSRGERFKLQWHNDLLSAGSLRGAAGVEAEREILRSAYDESRRGYAFYSQLGFSPFSRLQLDGGWRLDDSEGFSSARSWHFSGRYVLPQGTQLRFAYGTAFRAPSLSENFGLWGNPNLRPEKSRSWDLGVEQWLAGKQIHWGLTYFNNRLRDLINADFTNQILINTDRAAAEGLESFAAFKPAANLDVRLDYTWTSAHDRDHRRLLRRPIKKADLDLVWAPSETVFSLQLNYTGEREDLSRDRFIRKRLGGYTTVDLSLRHALSPRSSAFLQVSNFLDKDYEPVDGYQGAGRAVRVGFEYIVHQP